MEKSSIPASPHAPAVRTRKPRRRSFSNEAIAGRPPETGFEVDPYRNIVFPNRIREQRTERGLRRLYALSQRIPALPYIRLSKIERGEVFPRVEELRQISGALDVAAQDLLIDVESSDFDIAAWALPFQEGAVIDSVEDLHFSALLAGALRAKRLADSKLTAATMAREYGIPPVILSRIENAFKCVNRWNSQTISNLFRVFEVDDMRELEALVLTQHKNGELEPFLNDLPTPASRMRRTTHRIAELRKELQAFPSAAPVTLSKLSNQDHIPRMLPTFGAPLDEGLIAMTPIDQQIEAPSFVGARAFGLRIGRATLGGGLPGQATVIVDPDRYPQAGGLALARDGGGYRVLAVAIGKTGAMVGYSTFPEREMPLSDLPTGDIASIVAAIFV